MPTGELNHFLNHSMNSSLQILGKWSKLVFIITFTVLGKSLSYLWSLGVVSVSSIFLCVTKQSLSHLTSTTNVKYKHEVADIVASIHTKYQHLHTFYRLYQGLRKN